MSDLELPLYYRHITAMTAQPSTIDFAAGRAAMVENQLRPEGVVDPAVTEAMGSVPRETFVPEQLRAVAYTDRALDLGGGRFLPAPAVLGQLLVQMMPQRGQRALVIGSAPGYSAAVLAAMGLDVTAVENPPLDAGDPEHGPYEQILIDGAVEFIPEPIIDQLADGGRLGTALIDRGVTRLIVGRKASGAFGYLSITDAGVPALPGFSRPKEFIF
jgi:protein-L-isoaspartate(D-aspartate) O-methyltransferase